MIERLFMKKFHFLKGTHQILLVAAMLTAISSGCVGVVSSDASPDPMWVDDDYVYYPGYELYYGERSHRYYHRDGDHWRAGRAPYGVRENILHNSPSVHMDFHDSPAAHHNQVIHDYPKTWRPAPHSGHEEHK